MINIEHSPLLYELYRQGKLRDKDYRELRTYYSKAQRTRYNAGYEAAIQKMQETIKKEMKKKIMTALNFIFPGEAKAYLPKK